MAGPDPAVAAIRLAVRRTLAELPPGDVVVACSGGADSLALLAATVFETRRTDRRTIGVTVDHGLQEGSDAHASHVVEQMERLGVDETVTVRVQVSGAANVEAGAREGRYAALGQVAESLPAVVVLLGHTRDDQAESVLLGLARGSGGRSLTGMRRGFEVFRRPLLDLGRADTEAACRAEGIEWWTDPHNSDPRFLRARVRHDVLPVIERELGPGIAPALARTGEMLRDDMDALDDLAEQFVIEHADEDGLPVGLLRETARAIRTRALRLVLLAAGAPATDLTRAHVLAVDDLVHGGSGRSLDLPGRVRAERVGDRLVVGPPRL